MRGVLTALLSGALAMGLTGCSAASDPSSPSAAPTESAPSAPAGFVIRTGDGYRVAVPEAWSETKQATKKDVPAEYRVPYTGQPTLPPALAVWVDRTADLGSASVQAQLAQVKVRSQIPEAKIGELKETQVSGAVAAVVFDYTYRMKAATSVLDTPLQAADYKIRDLTVQVEGRPQFGFRYIATVADFDEEIWKTILASITVQADK